MRTLSSEWMHTRDAIDELGISAKTLRKLRKTMVAGKHYRVKNPRAARPEYIWQVEKIKLLLIPEP